MKVFFLFISLFCLISASTTIGREYRMAYLARSPELVTFGVLASDAGPLTLPLSGFGLREFFMTCSSIQQGLVYALQPIDTRTSVNVTCASMARKALVRNPTYSAAHTVIMLSSSEPTEIMQSLILSQMTAPREAWNAKLRLLKGLRFHGAGQTEVDDALESDIVFLVQSFGGRVWLANLYQSDEDLRPVLIGVIDQRPDTEKAAFLQEVRRFGQN